MMCSKLLLILFAGNKDREDIKGPSYIRHESESPSLLPHPKTRFYIARRAEVKTARQLLGERRRHVAEDVGEW